MARLDVYEEKTAQELAVHCGDNLHDMYLYERGLSDALAMLSYLAGWYSCEPNGKEAVVEDCRDRIGRLREIVNGRICDYMAELVEDGEDGD